MKSLLRHIAHDVKSEIFNIPETLRCDESNTDNHFISLPVQWFRVRKRQIFHATPNPLLTKSTLTTISFHAHLIDDQSNTKNDVIPCPFDYWHVLHRQPNQHRRQFYWQVQPQILVRHMHDTFSTAFRLTSTLLSCFFYISAIFTDASVISTRPYQTFFMQRHPLSKMTSIFLASTATCKI